MPELREVEEWAMRIRSSRCARRRTSLRVIVQALFSFAALKRGQHASRTLLSRRRRSSRSCWVAARGREDRVFLAAESPDLSRFNEQYFLSDGFQIALTASYRG